MGKISDEIGVVGPREGVESGVLGNSCEEEMVFELLDQEVDGFVVEHVLNLLVAEQIDPKELISVEGIVGLGVVEPQQTGVFQLTLAKLADFILNLEPHFSKRSGIDVDEYDPFGPNFGRY